jgi:hypothetical protein
VVASGALGRDLRAVVASIQVMAYGFGIHVPWQTLLNTIPVVVNILSTLPISWNGLGVRESGYVFFLRPLILSHEQAIAFGAMWLLATTASSAIRGLISFLSPEIVGGSMT